MANRSKNGGRALITGASGGIGLELAREFAAHGHSVILVARNEARLNEVAAELVHTYAVKANVIASDLGERSAPHALFGEVARRNLEVDILVNNAGLMETGAFKDADTETLRGIIQLNVEALTALTSLFLKPMAARGRGRILNVASLAGFQPLPSMAVYAASKAGLRAVADRGPCRGIARQGSNGDRALPRLHRHEYDRKRQAREPGVPGASLRPDCRCEIRRARATAPA
jgi:short-subunit dehydrogenase